MNAVTSAANITLIQSVYDAFGRGDVAFIVARLAADARWDFAVTESDVPWHMPVEGPEGVPNFLAAFIDNVDLKAFEPRHFIASGDDVVVHIRIAYTVRKTARHVDEDQLHWWVVREGRIATLRHFEDTAQVIGAWRG